MTSDPGPLPVGESTFIGESVSSNIIQGINGLLLAAAIAVFVGYFGIYLLYARGVMSFPYDYDQGEGFEVNDAVLFSKGQWPYRDNAVYPFYASNYPPLFHLMMIPLFPLVGKTLLAGRLVSFAATLVIGTTVGILIWRKTRLVGVAALCGLMVFASNYIYHIGPLSRLHLIMVMFELLAVVFIAEADDARHGTRNLVIGLVMLTAAGWTKQMALATVLAAFLYLFIRNRKRALISGAIFCLVNAGLFLVVNVATHGQWYVNIIQANVNAYDFAQAWFLYQQWFRLHWVIILLAAAFVVYEAAAGRWSAYAIWFVVTVLDSALAGKWGAGESYFTTTVVAACVCAGFQISNLKYQISNLKSPHLALYAQLIFGALVPILFLFQARAVLHMPTDGRIFGMLAQIVGVGRRASVYKNYSYYDSGGYTQLGHIPADYDHTAAQRIQDYVSASPGPALTEEATWTMRAGKDVVTNPTQLLNLYNNKLYDPANLVEMINRQAFGVIVLRAQFYPDPVLQAIGQKYRSTDEVDMNGFTYHILVPK
jgi:hypothetical protein